MIRVILITISEKGGGAMPGPRVIGERLRALRGARRMTQVSEETGIGQSTLSNYENGIRIPRDETKVVLAKYYGVSVESIFFDSE